MKRNRSFDKALVAISDNSENQIEQQITLTSATRAGVSMMAWMILNIALSLLNKYLFQEKDFRFPVLIIICGTFFTFVGCFICVFVFKLAEFPYGTVVKNWKLLFLLSVSQGLTTAFENISIVYISISLNQVIKSTMPAGTIIAAILFERKMFSRQLVISTVVIVVGAALAVFKNPEFHWVGVLTAIASMLLGVVQAVATGFLLQRTSLNVLIIALTISLPGLVSLVPIFLLTEYESLPEHMTNSNSGEILLIILFISVLAFFYNMSHYLLINYTSAHYAVLFGNVKVLVLVVISMAIFNTPFTAINLVGMVLSLAGFCAYNFVRYLELKVVRSSNQDEVAFTDQVVNRLLSEKELPSSSSEDELKPL